MLILSRKAGQRITLEVGSGEHDRKIVLRVLDVKGSIVRLGLEADSNVKVERNAYLPMELQTQGDELDEKVPVEGSLDGAAGDDGASQRLHHEGNTDPRVEDAKE